MRLWLCLILICLAYQNCSDIDVVPWKQNIDLDSNDDGGFIVVAPTPTPAPRVNKLLLCKSDLVNGSLRYQADVVNIATNETEESFEVGNCYKLLVTDMDADGNQEWIDTFWNSTLHPCQLKIYDAKSNDILVDRSIPGTVTSGNGIMCNSRLDYYKTTNGANELLLTYENNNTNQRGYQILQGIDASISFNQSFSNAMYIYTLSIGQDTNNDNKPEAWAYTAGSYDNIVGFRGSSFHYVDGTLPLNTSIHEIALPDNHLPSNAISLGHPTLASRHLLLTDIQEMVPYSQGGLINSAKAIKVQLLNENFSILSTMTINNIKTGNFNFQYQYRDKADFNGDDREDAILSQGTGEYSQYTEVRNGNDLSVIVKVDKAWLIRHITDQNISEQIVYMGNIDYNNDGKNELIMKYYSFNGNRTFLVVIGVDGEVFLTKELPAWSYYIANGLRYHVN